MCFFEYHSSLFVPKHETVKRLVDQKALVSSPVVAGFEDKPIVGLVAGVDRVSRGSPVKLGFDEKSGSKAADRRGT